MARSTADDDWQVQEREGGRVILVLVLGLALLAGCCYVAAYLGASDKVPVGTRVGDVDIGGQSPSTAVATLRQGLGARARMPFTVTIAGRTEQVRPRDVGLGVDYVATVRASGAGHSWAPSHLWSYYTAGGAVDPVITLDQLKLAGYVTRIEASDGRAPSDAAVVFRHDSFRVTAPRPGIRVDPQAAATAFWSAYLSDDPAVALPLTPTPPVIDSASVHRFVKGFANPALASPVELRFGHTPVRLQPAAYSHLLGSHRVGNALKPTVKAKALSALVDERLAGSDPVDAPHDATVALVGGRPRIVRSRPGLVFAPAAVAAALLKAIASPHRSAHVQASLTPARFTNSDARKLRIRHPISFDTVNLPRGLATSRLVSAATRLDGTVLHPGDSLSLREVLAGAIPSHTAATALATGVFNAAWLGGLQLGSHATLASYTGDYPVGRDASLRDGQDLAFTDDTHYGVLVSVVVGRPTSRHHGSLTVTLWSTPQWDVTSSHSDPVDVVPAGSVVRRGPHCRDLAGRDGFDVTVTRSFSAPGSAVVDHTSSYPVHYEPVPAVRCRAHRH